MKDTAPPPPPESGLHFLDYWRVIRSRKEIILAVTLLVVLTGTAFTFTLPKIYVSECRMRVFQDNMDIDVFQREMAGGYNPFFLRTEYEVIQSKTILYRVIQNLGLQKTWGEELNDDGSPISRERAAALLRKHLTVRQYRDTSLISIRVESEDPAEAARIANEIANVYGEFRLGSKRQEVMGAIDVLKTQLQKQRDRVDAAEEEVERLRKKLGVSEVGRGVRADKMRLSQLEADRISARVEMLARKARLDQIKDLSGQDLVNASLYLVNDQTLASIRKQLIDSEVSLRLLLENYGANHPDVKRVKAAVDELQKKLDAALEGLKKGVEADYAVYEARFEALDTELNAAQASDIQSESERFRPFDKAQRELDAQRAILRALEARVYQEGIEIEVPRTPVKVVDVAEPGLAPVRPNLVLNVILSLIVGLGSGVALAFFIEYLDTSVKTVDDVERYLGLPVVGVIPQKVHHLISEGPESPHAESYRVLRTNLQFHRKGKKKCGAIAVTSGGVGEGKSTTLSNLAYICAMLGDKVLIVDSDMRRPIQHTILGLQNRVGLSNVLSRNVPIEEMIQPTSVPNLHFLPSGKMSRSQVGLLDETRISELIDDLKDRYDFVFLDSPPLMGVSDASVLASLVDGVLLVVQYRKYPRIISSRAKRILDSVGANCMGVVLNNINIMRDDYYYYYHSYYSHYQQPITEETPDEASAASEKEQLL